MRYANIIINISHEAVDRPFTYIIPDSMTESIHPGTRVIVPFGNGNKDTMGYVLEITEHPQVPIARLKEICRVVLEQDATDSKLIELAGFIKEQYGSTMINALKTVLPTKKAYKPRKRKRNDEEVLSEEDIIISLNEEQRTIVDDFMKDYDNGVRNTYLVHGITGSGKTEVYIEIIKQIVARGKQAIVLIPEIGLSYQTEMRFRRYFGDRVSIMNSTLAAGERYEHCEKAKSGEIDVIIGPRSALFTPFSNVGIIVIDEEHENTYKSENVPRYHAREVAERLAEMHGASLLLGSATPSVDSYYRAKSGKYKLYTLSRRAAGGELPKVHIADLRAELKEGNRSIFSRKLAELMKERLDSGQQIMLFLNRRGYAGFVSCRSCGEVIKCPHCDVSLSEHKKIGKMVCHYCGYETQIPKLCPSCGSKYISSFRAGTEQIEAEVNKLFPTARTLRMDADTTKRKDSYERILSAFKKQEADVLIGTQMIVKGHDFPNVTLVGIIAADLSLASGDYRAGERTFQLLTQAAGRAGRGEKAGEVVIQTYQPDQYSVRYASTQDYYGFYDEEILYREISGYPPVKEIMAVLIAGKDADTTFLYATNLTGLANSVPGGANIVGPAKAGIGKINDLHRYVFYAKSDDKGDLIRIKDAMEAWIDENKTDVGVWFDFNPMNPY
ncbi:MAG: primosomal protein N' [Lachnospiraceae bacterium]|nr:primosomal protein N' [Candidatus Colinaster scatohippi]